MRITTWNHVKPPAAQFLCPDDKLLELPDSLLHYRIDGSGPKLVLIHPVGLDLTFFDPLVAELSARYRILRMDLPGHGASPPAPPAPTLSDYADAVHKLLAHVSWIPSAVAGFSFGGMLAQVLAIEHPNDAHALIIAACPSTLPSESRQILLERGALAEREGMPAVIDATMERWFTPRFRSEGRDRLVRARLLSGDVHGWAAAWRAMAKIDTAPHLNSIQVPSLCLAGEWDLSAPPAVVAAIAEQVPAGRFTVIPRAPHMLFIEQPGVVADEIAKFLSDVL